MDIDGVKAATTACEVALAAANLKSAGLAGVFAGARHDGEEYRDVLRAVSLATGAESLIGCSTTGILTATDELENADAVAVLVLDGDARLPTPIVETGVRSDPRGAGVRLGRAAVADLNGVVEGAIVVVLVDPQDLDATAFLAGLAEGAPGLTVTGAGASSGESGARVFAGQSVFAGAAVALALPASILPTTGTSHGCQGVSGPLTITAVDGNVILEIDGRSPVDVLKEILDRPANRPLGRLSVPLLAGIGDPACYGRSDYVVRPFLVPDDDPRSLAVPEPVRTGQTIRFTLRDAIGARDDMKAMLDEQVEARGDHRPSFGLYFNCAGRGSALYGQSGLDPELIQRRFHDLALVGIESSFEIAPTCGRPQVHMLTGVLLLAG
ncbi:MAG: FIST C-terminal domain-containing protein [Deltaproteobacteria bacterium]|nr:FIST C-terminal domain-containing protein [Deltaproteobacteria bacterium]